MHWIALAAPTWPEAPSPPPSPSPPEHPSARAQPVPSDWQALGCWALRFTPRVVCLGDAVLLEVQASVRLFGGLRALLKALLHPEPAQPRASRWARGPTARSALARLRAHARERSRAEAHQHLHQHPQAPSRCPDTPLDELPLDTLDEALPHLPALHALGCRQWGQVRRLPRSGLVRRFGPALLQALDQAYGELPQPWVWLELPATYDQTLELEHTVDAAPALMFMVRRLLLGLQAWLCLRHLGVRSLHLEWVHDQRHAQPQQPCALQLGTAEPQQQMAHLERLLAERLQRVVLAAPVSRLRLHTQDVVPMHAPASSFFCAVLPPDAQHQTSPSQAAAREADPKAAASQAAASLYPTLSALAERLAGRLGDEAVLRVALHADARLEARQAWLPAARRAPHRERPRALTPHKARRRTPAQHPPRPCAPRALSCKPHPKTRGFGPLGCWSKRCPSPWPMAGPKRPGQSACAPARNGWKPRTGQRRLTPLGSQRVQPLLAHHARLTQHPQPCATTTSPTANKPAGCGCTANACKPRRGPSAGSCMADSLEGAAVDEPLHPSLPDYAELHVQSAFSFRRGASRPTELVERAHALGYRALALTDEASVAGVVQAHERAQQLGLQFIPAAGFDVAGHWRLLLLPTSTTGWGDLCEFITAQRSAPPGQQRPLDWPDVQRASLRDCEAVLVPHRLGRYRFSNETLLARATWLRTHFEGRAWLALELLHAMDDALWLQRLRWVEAHSGVPLLATGDVQLHVRSRKPLHDVLTALRQGRSVHDCGDALHPNAEAHLRSRERLAALYPPDTLARTLDVAARCRFNLKDIRYQYPNEPLEAYAGRGWNATQALRHATTQGAAQRYPQGVPAGVQRQIEHELALIAELGYEMYFLTVHDLVLFARGRGILCQGRGSAANSVVCFCLGITEVDPARMSTLFERFISRERREPPDIDVDFEHQRREEVIQYIYRRYGRDRAALAATVIHYQPRSALREAARALGVPPAWADAIARQHFWFDGHGVHDAHTTQRLVDAGLDPQDPLVQRWLQMAAELLGLPRHLSQHVGGFVLTQGKLTRLVPVEHAAMPERSIIQWDKDDLDAMGLLKVDVLALGMLSAIRRCLELVGTWRGQPLRLQDIPDGDAPTYDMICAADTVGVFQIESRAQMAMLPRLRPRCFYDLVIEVAIVRPGPIQGGMVHPYLKRRRQLEPVTYPSEALRQALGRTLGVPIFQEQVMQIAMLAAGFSADEADQLRRSMAAWKRKGGVHHFYDRIVGGMVARGYTAEFAKQIFSQIEGFGEYGFPESHAASFALLVYASCWLKCHEPACFLVAMLNAQPLGFYSPSQLVQDARRHGVQVRPVDVSHSDWDCTLEWPDGEDAQATPPQPAVRLGLRMVKGLSEAGARRLVKARGQMEERAGVLLDAAPGAAFPVTPGAAPVVLGAALASAPSASPPAHTSTWRSVDDLAERAALDQRELQALAAADALASLAGHRREQVWQARAWQVPAPLLAGAVIKEEALRLPEAPEGEAVVLDHQHTGLTLRRHPLALLRPRLDAQRWLRASDLQALGDGTRVRACGLVTMRQQPVTAKGVVFVTLEDETGNTNVIVWKALRERQRQELLHARLLGVQGRWQRDEETGGQVRHLVAQRLYDLTPWLGLLAEAVPGSRDFR